MERVKSGSVERCIHWLPTIFLLFLPECHILIIPMSNSPGQSTGFIFRGRKPDCLPGIPAKALKLNEVKRPGLTTGLDYSRIFSATSTGDSASKHSNMPTFAWLTCL